MKLIRRIQYLYVTGAGNVSFLNNSNQDVWVLFKGGLEYEKNSTLLIPVQLNFSELDLNSSIILMALWAPKESKRSIAPRITRPFILIFLIR